MRQKNGVEKCLVECPPDFGWQKSLIALYSLQQFEHTMDRGITYSPSTFYKKIQGTLSGIRNYESRTTRKNHLHSAKCTACQEPIDIRGKQLDHIVPKALGGTDHASNEMLLCRSHNSSKGKRDLLDWWMIKGWDPLSLPRNVICLYARSMWHHIEHDLFIGPQDPPESVRVFITERTRALPTNNHRTDLYGSTYLAMASLKGLARANS